MLFKERNKIRKILLSYINLSLSISYILLQIESHRFRETEIAHSVRHFKAHFLGYSKEVIYGIPAGENNSRMLLKFNLLRSQIFSCYPLYFSKRTKINFYFVFLYNLMIR